MSSNSFFFIRNKPFTLYVHFTARRPIELVVYEVHSGWPWHCILIHGHVAPMAYPLIGEHQSQLNTVAKAQTTKVRNFKTRDVYSPCQYFYQAGCSTKSTSTVSRVYLTLLGTSLTYARMDTTERCNWNCQVHWLATSLSAVRVHCKCCHSMAIQLKSKESNAKWPAQKAASVEQSRCNSIYRKCLKKHTHSTLYTRQPRMNRKMTWDGDTRRADPHQSFPHFTWKEYTILLIL